MRFIALAALCAASSCLLAQDEPTLLGDDISFDDDFGFGAPFEEQDSDPSADAFSDPFAIGGFNAFEDSGRDALPAWLSGFTVKLSHQLLFQTRTHESRLALPGGSVLSVPRQADVETNRLAANVRYQNAFAPGWLLQASGFARLFIYDDYEYEARGQEFGTEFRLNEFFLQRSFGDHSVKLGNQTVVWGEVDGNSVLDVINIVDFRDFSAIDIEDIRMNQPMLVWEYFGDRFGERSQLSTFVTLYPEYNPPLMRGSPFYSEPEYHISDYKRRGNLDFEGGVRWSRSFEGSDIAFMAAYLIENQPTYSAPANPADDAIATNNGFSLLGFSANRAFGKLLLNLDVAYTQGVLVNNINLPSGAGNGDSTRRRDQLGTSLGFEYAIDNEQTLAVSLQVLKPLDEQRDAVASSQETGQETGIWQLRYSNALMNGDLALALTLQGDIEGQFSIMQASANRTLSDNWAAAINLTLLEGEETSPISLFEGDIRLGFNLTYSF